MYRIRKFLFWLWLVGSGIVLAFKQWQIDQLIKKLGID